MNTSGFYGFALQLTTIHAEIEDIIVVLMFDEHGQLSHLDLDTQPLIDLSPEGFLIALSIFNPPAWEFPKKRQDRCRTTLSNKKSTLTLNLSSNDSDIILGAAHRHCLLKKPNMFSTTNAVPCTVS